MQIIRGKIHTLAADFQCERTLNVSRVNWQIFVYMAKEDISAFKVHYLRIDLFV